jgi:hypothetical protein
MIIIGGSGSTGSSLLQSILNRHPKIVAGQETSIFIYPHLYHQWSRYKRFLIDKGPFGVKSTGWSIRNGMDLLHEDYGWQKGELLAVIRQTDNMNEFVDAFFERPLLKKGASTWVEKTPQNACAFYEFLTEFPQGKVVHMVRDPYDTMASLIARGFEPYLAAGYYVYHTAAAASADQLDPYICIDYTDLVDKPEDTMRILMNFIGLDFDPTMLVPSKKEVENPLKLKGWNHSERDYVKRSSLGRFEKLSKEEKNEIIAALQVFQISKRHMFKFRMKFSNFKELCKYYDYEYQEVDPSPFISSMKISRYRDMMSRTLRLHPGHILNYPGNIIQ